MSQIESYWIFSIKYVQRQHTSPIPFSAHHSPREVLRISPRTRKSKGTGLERDKALLTSWDRWYRFQDDGIMNFCAGSEYGV